MSEYVPVPKPHIVKQPEKAPIKLSPELIAAAEKFILEGNRPSTSFAAMGVSERTYFNWMKRGAVSPKGNIFRDFHDRVLRAEAESERLMVSRIQAISLKKLDAKALLNLLELRFPERWGKKTTLEVHGQVDHTHSVAQREDFLGLVSSSPEARKHLNEAMRHLGQKPFIDVEAVPVDAVASGEKK